MRSENRILTTHVGSLIRPPDLANLLRKRLLGEPVAEAAFSACLEAAVAEVVRAQADLGLDIINDGEFGKTISWSKYVLERLSGIVQQPVDQKEMPAGIVGRDRREFADFYREYDGTQKFFGLAGWQVNGPIRYVGHPELTRDIEDLKRALAGRQIEGAFMTAVAPASVIPDRDDRFYKT